MTHARIRFTLLLSTVFLLVVSLALVSVQSNRSKAATVASPMIFGAAADSMTMVQSHEKALGGHMEGVRVYKHWGGTLFGKSQYQMRDTGHTLFVSVKAMRTGGGAIRFADIANAAPGSTLYRDMQSMAAQIKAFRSPVYFIFNHEPEARASRTSGDGPQYAAAWRKIVTVFRNEGVTNAKYVATFTGFGFTRKDSHNVAYYYPGDAYVDAVAADVYNWGWCRGMNWRSMAALIEGIRVWGTKHPTEKLMLMEWGSAEDRSVPGRKAQWIREATALFKQPGYQQFSAILQWGGRNMSGRCGFDYTTSASATDAWRDMGADPAYAAR